MTYHAQPCQKFLQATLIIPAAKEWNFIKPQLVIQWGMDLLPRSVATDYRRSEKSGSLPQLCELQHPQNPNYRMKIWQLILQSVKFVSLYLYVFPSYFSHMINKSDCFMGMM